jgi:hypothetical protein
LFVFGIKNFFLKNTPDLLFCGQSDGGQVAKCAAKEDVAPCLSAGRQRSEHLEIPLELAL